uniref:Vasoactive intestinal peptide receptor 2 n=1 Tax=Cyclopterus lumpus TaxID=8103 RepID=A0A8C2ZW66_CYCLU
MHDWGLNRCEYHLNFVLYYLEISEHASNRGSLPKTSFLYATDLNLPTKIRILRPCTAPLQPWTSLLFVFKSAHTCTTKIMNFSSFFLLFFLFFPPTEPACKGTWDSIACWERTEIGETVTISCPRVLTSVFGRNGGFTCSQFLVFYVVVKTLYTLGHSLSLIALTTGSAILCLFRKLHCTRNYIHLNLFFSFVLRAVAVLVKDDILFNRTSQCSSQPSLVGCKASLVFFQYFIMANFFWLLVEGLYLHTLLVVIFSENRHFIVYMFIGWGIPTVFVFAWVMTRIYLEDTGQSDSSVVFSSPVSKVNFILFISIIRILVQKLRCPDVGGNDQSQYRRLAKSTLLLIPLFGIHYVVFVSLSESIAEAYKIFFDLALGSFQVLPSILLFKNNIFVALFLQVQGELKRKWQSMCLNCRLSRDNLLNSTFASRNGSEHMVQFHRNSRTQSILQSETTVL